MAYYYNEDANKTITGTSGDDSIQNFFNNVTIAGGAGNDTILNYSANVSVYGGAGNDTIRNDTGTYNSISGGTGNDSIDNTGSNVLFTYAAGDGNDTINGFNATSTLQIGNGTTDTYYSETVSSDVVVTVGEGKITLTGAANLSTVNILGMYNDPSQATLTDDGAAKITIDSAVEVVDASARTAAIEITGNELDNSIVGGAAADKLYGEDGDDTLWGGDGDDTLTGGYGEDVFIYNGEGNDVINDFADNDLLEITGDWTAAVDASTIKFTVGDGSLTLKNYTATTFNINGDTYVLGLSKK